MYFALPLPIVSGNSGGGLVGSNQTEGHITHCYSTGAVFGNSDGLIGHNFSGNVTYCFWDIQTSGLTESDGGTGKTTAEMQTAINTLSYGLLDSIEDPLSMYR